MKSIALAAVGAVLMGISCAAEVAAPSKPEPKPSKVEIAKRADGWHLLKDGQEYFVRGACAWDYMKELKEAGGNSIRTWGAATDPVLYDKAQAQGLTVCAGLWLPHADDRTFNYSDAQQVDAMVQRFKVYVQANKNHPALLMWGIGNEMEIGMAAPDPMWQAIEKVAKMIKEVDPNHPTITVIAGASEPKIKSILKFCPTLDALGVNTYVALAITPSFLKSFGWEKAYLITEFGTPGDWETRKTSWGAALEMNSSVAAQYIIGPYTQSISGQKGWCLGSYVFFWGTLEESPHYNFSGSHTWFEMFLDSREAMNTADAMQLVWTGRCAANRAPEITYWDSTVCLRTVPAGSPHTAVMRARDPDGDMARVRWEIRPEKNAPGQKNPVPVSGCFDKAEGEDVSFKAPAQPGNYRLFVYAYDGKGKVAVANNPFVVGPAAP